MAGYTRKEAARKLGIGIETLRYYEKLGLIVKPGRALNGYRVYSEKDISSIDHILHIKKYGFSLGEIKKMIEVINPDVDFKKTIVVKKLKAIQNTIRSLEKQKRDLRAFLKSLQ